MFRRPKVSRPYETCTHSCRTRASTRSGPSSWVPSAPDNPNRVKVSIDGQQIYVNDASSQGWLLDGKIVRLQAGACQKMRDGLQHQLDVSVECADIPPPS